MVIKTFCRKCKDFTQFKTKFHKADKIHVTECNECGEYTARGFEEFKMNGDRTKSEKTWGTSYPCICECGRVHELLIISYPEKRAITIERVGFRDSTGSAKE